MKDWLVGGGVIEGPSGVLLVENLRRDNQLDWSPPGGVIDPGETLIEGLSREVHEETGLVVTNWVGPIYIISAEAPDMGWRLRVEAFVAASYSGEVTVGDPDGIVVGAGFFGVDACADRLGGSLPWVREPLLDWLADRDRTGREYRYEVHGTDRRSATVIRR